ncbi:MAG: hypothetical protein V2J19_06805 [Wenzhouxiangella sp.]|jgi:hypothetical protein|nr:hypothetical protein [Wenzhouxiangella sp.]
MSQSPLPQNPEKQPDHDHWLVRPKTIRLLWWIFGVILALTVAGQFFVHFHAYFGVDGWFGFYAVYGFLTCVGMVVGAKLLGFVLKRPDDYYFRETELAPSQLTDKVRTEEGGKDV